MLLGNEKLLFDDFSQVDDDGEVVAVTIEVSSLCVGAFGVSLVLSVVLA